MESIANTWAYVWPFLLIITVVVFGHEMGHYLIARLNRIRVEVFSIGFGPELFGWTDRAGTRWKVSALPLGGYVKFFGDLNAASAPGAETSEMPPEERAVCFHHKRLGQRAAVILAGPLANFILAAVILAVLFATIGQRVTPPDISEVLPDSAAAEAGLQPGDVILSIDGREIGRFEDLQKIVRESAGQELTLVVLRGEWEETLVVIPRTVEHTDRFGNTQRIGLMGVSRAGVIFVRHGPATAVLEAVKETASITGATLRAVGQMIAGTRTTEELGGPIRIAHMSSQVAKEGLVTLLWFMAVLSINLGLINLFPVPMLDGGHLIFYAFEAVRGRPMSIRFQEWGFRIGLALVLTLMVFATWNDFVNLGVFDFFIGIVS